MNLGMFSENEVSSRVYSVFEITKRVKHVLETAIEPVWVEGEISNFKHHTSGHLYFSMKDAWAQLRCVMFRSAAAKCLFRPENGMKIRAFGSIGVFEKFGYYQFIVQKMEEIGRGDLHQAFERLKLKLKKEGLFESVHKKPIPRFPKRIGVVTSETGAAIRDIVNVISRRFPLVELLLCPARVQGEGAAEEIVRSIRTFDRMPDASKPDVLIVGRGGGSLEDLWAFNEEITARAIYTCSIPVISAVGHEIDYTISDFVADRRAPTPSAAAELAVPDKRNLMQSLAGYADRLTDNQMRRFEFYRLRIKRLESSYFFKPQHLIHEFQQSLDMLSTRIEHGMQDRLGNARSKLHNCEVRLNASGPGFLIHRWEQAFHRIEHDFVVHGTGYIESLRRRHEEMIRRISTFNLKDYRARLDVLSARFQGYDPKNILRRGYAICTKRDGTMVVSCKDVSEKEQLDVELADGHLECKVERKGR